MRASETATRAPRRWLAGAVAAFLATSLTGFVAATEAAADVSPVSDRSSAGVTADALPTVQIDGVVWSQAVVGNTVYAGGSFANARPAGAAAGTNLTPRGNLLAYNLTTGALITSFVPTLNAQVKAVAASPDGSRIYVGGSFTTANGQNRYRLAAYSTDTGALIGSFAPTLDATVNSISATNSAVYVGGVFGTANGVTRTRLAAFSATTGAVLGWAPTADAVVDAVQLTPDGSHVVVGGAFQNVNGAAALGLASLDSSSGAMVPFAVNQVVKDYGAQGAILSLSTDGTAIYGTGYAYGNPSNFEGAFSADPSTGAINWLADCHGDSYGAFGSGDSVYVVSHEHFCSNIGGFPDTSPRSRWQRTTAFSANATGTVLHNSESGAGYGDFYGQPSPSLRTWFPNIDIGTYTKQNQGAWTVTGNSNYVVEGGEFLHVNGSAQQGLVRFAVSSIAPDKQGPQVTDTTTSPSIAPLANSVARISWQTNWDLDDQNLTYQLYRQDRGNSTPIYSVVAASQFWNRPTLTYQDSGLTGGQTYTYWLKALDPSGNVVRSANVSTTMPTNVPLTVPADSYGAAVANSVPDIYWRLDDTSGRTAADISVNGVTGQFSGGYTLNVPSPVSGTSGTAVTFNGTNGTLASSRKYTNPTAYSEELWFRTTTTRGGKLIGFGSSASGNSGSYDRHVYMLNSGQLVFGAYPGQIVTVTSPGSYNDGQWHYLAATQGSDGMRLYVDGAMVGSDPNSVAQNYSGYWRVGGDTSWGGSSSYFAGSIDEAAIYLTALPAAQLRAHYRASPAAVNASPTPAFSSVCTNLSCTFDATASADPDGSVASYAWDFGDGSSATGATPSHSFGSDSTFTVTLSVTDDSGAVSTLSHQVTTTLPPNAAPIASLNAACSQLTCSVDASASSDPDGSVVNYAWDFGDGSSASGMTTSHLYAAGGTYVITLTVTDNRGGTDSTTRSVTVGPNQAPRAVFTQTCDQLVCTFDASSSSDPDGSVVDYAWTFGDGSSGTGAILTHTFAALGQYSIGLTVTDNSGSSTSVTSSVSASAVVAADGFGRTTSSGWGSADTGGAWTTTGGASLFTTGSGVGSLLLNVPGAAPLATLKGLSRTNVVETVDVSADRVPTGNGYFLAIKGRVIGTSNYTLKLRLLPGGVVHLVLSKVIGGAETVFREVNIPSLTFTPGDSLRVQFGISGNGAATTLAGSVWRVGTAAPVTAQITQTDSESTLQGAGAIALQGYLSGTSVNSPVVMNIDNLSVQASS